MPMSFPDFDSLKRRAHQRNFRQPKDGETEQEFRTAFADFMLEVDRVESAEIRSGKGWDEMQHDPAAMLRMMGFGDVVDSIRK
ncbi:hypothetical protein HOU08_gp248 [Dickeya phage vB_DsoM_JA29]|uniref:Uncharacterized protein n=1 Tax=Dickeya phage vB_DsoM_JA29 TaxID=2283031 RepID=A0A384ZXL0_9CAUD|nr:hypothetical protein HOU08_gp248 [Dickeya phage vB_DsoM_JA29]AXG66974.1 hypothetical protein JA29_248 [Dickeya phage vB_DsoM_JA29]